MNVGYKCLFFGILLYIASGNRVLGADAPVGWSIPRFSDDAAALFKAASSVTTKPGTDVIVLYNEESYVYDPDGKETHTSYLVYKVLSQKGADGWDGISTQWEPWHENKPEVRARVITPDGAVHPLDPKTISDTPASEDDDKVYSDRRVVRAPLPAIALGSVVEEEEITRENAALFNAGVVSQAYFSWNVPAQELRLILDVPATLPLHYAKLLLPDMEEKRTEENGRVHVVFTQGPMEAREDTPKLLPMDVAIGPRVTVSTASSWQAVAERYSRTVDEKVALADVQGLVSGLVKGKTSREERVTAVLQYLSREIRYTGVEFDETAIVPHSPAETLKHKYGDCKDKATLLIAMLRAAGVPSYLALLNAGSREDVPAEFPGMGLFDHAIVYAPGEPDFWIDATDEYARLGQLPISDQGRQALIARPESKALVQIPEAPSQSNLILEKREFYLAENGPSRVVETTEPHGVFETEFRSYYADEANKDNRKNLTEYVKSQYLADRLSRTERSSPGDLSKQFQLILEAGGAKRGSTDLDVAVVAIRVESLFDKLPDELQERRKEEEKNTDPAADKPKKPRTADYQLPEAFVHEWQYKIAPPVGFQAKPLPPNAKVSLGPAVLTEEFSLEKDGTVHAMLRFDAVKRRLTVSEATEMGNKVAQLREGQAILIYFEPIAQALLAQGKVREAFQANRDLIALHPKEAVHHLQRAKALLGAGMGQAAREEAREAVKLEPSSALGQKTLAEILEYDLVGRQFRRGSDYPGAATAFRAAKKLDPDDHTIPGNLAILLEYNEEGERYGPGAKLKEAIAEYKSLTEEQLAKIGLKNNLAYTLLYAGEFVEAKKYSEGLNPSPNAVIVAAEAALNGAQAGIAEAHKLIADETNLKSSLRSAGEMLTRMKKYSIAADLMEASASGDTASNTIGFASLLRKTRPRQEIVLTNDPISLVREFFIALGDEELTGDRILQMSSRRAQEVLRNADPDELKQSIRVGQALRRTLSRLGYPADVMMDVVMQALDTKVEGDDASGYKATLRPAAGKSTTMFIVKEEGKYKILDSADKPNVIGFEILARLMERDTAGARVLLDWVREEEHLAGGDDALAGYAFPRLWTKGKDADPEQMKVAAAAIMAQSRETAVGALPILEGARIAAKNDTDKLNISLALLTAYSSQEAYDKLHGLSAELEKQYPESRRLFFDDEFALRGLGRFAEADALAEDRLKRLPDDLDAMRAYVRSAESRGDYALAYDRNQKIVSTGKAESSDFNSIAWDSLFTGKTSQADLDSATKSARLSQNASGVLHTLGCVYAELGKTKEAREVLIQAMDQLNLDEPDANYWYAFGRIAEQYRETQVAIADYKQAEKPKKAYQIPGSSYQLAQNHLKALDITSPSGGTRKNGNAHRRPTGNNKPLNATTIATGHS